MNGLSQQARLVAGFSSLAVHIAIGAHLMWRAQIGTPEAGDAETSSLVVEMIPLSATMPTASVAPVPFGAVPPSPTDPRMRRELVDQGLPHAAERPIVFDIPTIAAASVAAPPAESLVGLTSASFQDSLLLHIERFRHYPVRARRDGVEGVALLSFSMDRSGRVLDAWIERSSGSVVLDAEALAAIQRAQPLPPIPAAMPDRLAIVLPIAFSLN